MLLLTGPAGSGKTSLVLAEFRRALSRHDSQVRFLAPTATMARHIQNRLAREGFLLRPRLVQTLSRFLEPWAEDLPQVSDAHLYLMVEAAARRVNRPEFARVAHMPGFCASLARTLQEFSSARCDSRRLALHLPATPLGEAFLAVFREVDAELERRGQAMRSARLERMAERIRDQGMPGVSTLWLDGFHALPDPELAIIAAMARHAHLTVTLPSGTVTEPTRARLLAMGFTEQACAWQRPQPFVEVVEAPAIERETDEIARRIVAEAAAGRPFREMGIIVRNAEVYAPMLRAACERFGIPARFYLDAQLAEYPVTRYLAGIVDALLAGWEHMATLAVLRLHPELGNANAMDQFDFQVRERLPGRGLEALAQLPAGWPALAELLTRWQALEVWRQMNGTPAEWAARLDSLTMFYQRPQPSDRVPRETVELWRSQSEVLAGFAEAIGQAAAWFPPDRPIPLAEFWRAAKAILRLSPLRLGDERRNVVHVLSAYEARQWQLPVVFVCGLVEKQFPRYSPQDAFFPDAARRQLQAAGVRLRTTADAEAEEEFLFDSAVTRATAALTLSYPRFDDRGEQNLPSLYLERFPIMPVPSQAVLPRTLPAPAASLPAGLISAAELREKVGQKHRLLRVTAMESYVQCPFQFFGRYTLDLKEPPRRPEERLDARVQGNIVHQVVAEWLRAPQPIGPIFERAFAETCRKERIPPGYRTEWLRAQMRADLERFANFPDRPPGPSTSAEQAFEFPMLPELAVRGRIDRLDKTPEGRANVVDYKYSKKAGEHARNVNLLQGPLYLIAVEKVFGLEPGTMSYCGLRGGVQYVDQPLTRERLTEAAETVIRIAREVRAGNAEPRPADLVKCGYCTFKDICRYQAAAVELAQTEGM